MIWYDLRELLPKVYRKIETMVETAGTEDVELRGVIDVSSAICDNYFVQTCDIQTLQYYEQLLHINLTGYETVDDRRKTILLNLNSQQPYTLPFLKEQLNTILGVGRWTVNVANGVVLEIHIEDVFNQNVNSMVYFVNRIKPAHVEFHATIRMNSESQILPLVYTQAAKFGSVLAKA